jgi:hypothetical protein
MKPVRTPAKHCKKITHFESGNRFFNIKSDIKGRDLKSSGL